MNLYKSGLLLLLVSLFVGCGSVPERKAASSSSVKQVSGKQYNSPKVGKRVVQAAQGVVGKPYRYGGASVKGFDCSGLVYFSYKKAGLKVPRTALSLYYNTKHIKKSELRKGDLVFFKLTRKKTSHVGIYAGKNRFIHAPSSGKKVMVSKLSDPYWREHFVVAGRIN
jgi:cell wall-associated NlpC family hydrolase